MAENLLRDRYKELYKKPLPSLIDSEGGGRVYSTNIISDFISSRAKSGIIPPDIIAIIAHVPFLKKRETQEEFMATLLTFLKGRESSYHKKLLSIFNEIDKRSYPSHFDKFVTYYLTEPYTPRSKFFSSYINPPRKVDYTAISRLKKAFFDKFLYQDVPQFEIGKQIIDSDDFFKYVVACEYLWRRSRRFIQNQIYPNKSPIREIASRFKLPPRLVKDILSLFFSELMSGRYSETDIVSVAGYKVTIMKRSPFVLDLKINKRWK